MASKEAMHVRAGLAKSDRPLESWFQDITEVMHQIIDRLPDNEEDKK